MSITLREALVTSKERLSLISTTPWHDAERVVGFALRVPRETLLYASLEKPMPVPAYKRLNLLLDKRSAGIPLPYIIGEVSFYGRVFMVTPSVLIPRPETEVLVDQALQSIGAMPYQGSLPISIVDLGTGSGCIALSVCKELQRYNPQPKVRIFASDISLQALVVAKNNAKAHVATRAITFLQGDLLQPLNIKPQLIMANLPYLTPAQVAENPYLAHEPQSALVAGMDGFLLYRRLLQDVHEAGWHGLRMLLEIDPAQKQLCEEEVKLRWPSAFLDFVPDLHGFTRVARIML